MGYDKFDSNIYQDDTIKEEIIAKLGCDLKVDSVGYLSYCGLKKVIGKNHCYGCWNPDGYHETIREGIIKLTKYATQN